MEKKMPLKPSAKPSDVSIVITFANAELKPKYKALMDKMDQLVRKETGLTCEYKPDGGGAPAIINFSAKK